MTAQQQTEYACRQCGQAVEVVGARNNPAGPGVVEMLAPVRPARLGETRCRTCGGNADWRER